MLITPRRVGGGGVKQLVLSVSPSVRPSVRCLSTQKSGYLAIYRVKRFLNTTVTLKSKKKCSGVYLIVAKAVSFAVSTALSYLTNGALCHFNTVTTRIRLRPGIYGLWSHVHIGNQSRPPLPIGYTDIYAYTSAVHSACGYTASDIHVHFANYSISPVCSPASSKL